MDRLKHIGSRIKLYRKHQNLTLEELAYMIHKSTSTLWKYESGSVSIDILTLSDIAVALGVEISQLTDFRTDIASTASENNANFFMRHKRLYVYNLFSPWKDPLHGVMEITGNSNEAGTRHVVMCVDKRKESDLSDPLFIYTGTISSDNTFAFMEMQNASGMKDKLYILAKSPYWMRNMTRGMILSISQTYGCPSAGSMIFSTEKLELNDDLLEELSITDDQTMEMLLRTNLLLTL